MEITNKHHTTVNIDFRITKDIDYWKYQIQDFIDEYFNAQVLSIDISRYGIRVFNKNSNGGYYHFIKHTQFTDKLQVLTFIETLNAKNYYK